VNKEHNLSATTTTLSEKEEMGNCYSRNILIGCMFVAEKVGVVDEKKTAKVTVDNMENGVIMKLVH